jgi:endonuclease III
MADETASSKKSLKAILHALDKSSGKISVLSGEPPLDHAVYLILRDNWDLRKAAKALHLLQRVFVDWNEIRVTTGGELRSVLAPLGDRDVDVKIEKIRTLLENLYREYNCVHMDFLGEMDVEGQERFLSSMGVLNPAQIQILIQSLAGDELQVPQQAIRVLNRVGVMPRVHSANAARKHVTRMLDPKDLFSFVAHMAQHGEEICLPKSPRCGECVLVELCGFKRKVGLVG